MKSIALLTRLSLAAALLASGALLFSSACMMREAEPVPAPISQSQPTGAATADPGGVGLAERDDGSVYGEAAAEEAPAARDRAATRQPVSGSARAVEAAASRPDLDAPSIAQGVPMDASVASGRISGGPGQVGAGAVALNRQQERKARDAGWVQPTAPPPPPAVDKVADAESYTDYGVNGYTVSAQDHLSTFSIDVDTASYTIARRKLGEGALPPWESVRAEEFINYLKYDYAAPRAAAFNVAMEAMPDPFRPGHHILRVGVKGAEVSAAERPPLHLTFLVDVSGSMSSPDKLGLAKTSLHMLVDSLREDDTVALATYAGRVATILAPTSAAQKRDIHQAIEQLESGGSTAMSAGIEVAYSLAMKGFRKGEENRVVVLSDGDANVGRTSWESMLSEIKGYADQGVTLSTIGFGMGNYQDTLMEQLANKGDGNNFYVDSAEQARRVFVEDLGSTLLTIARDVKIQVDFNTEAVSAYRLIGYENRDIADKDFRNDRVDAGEVGAGHQVTALYDVVLSDRGDRALATVRLRYERPGPDGEATERAFSFQRDALLGSADQASRDTRMAYTAATFAEVLRQSPYANEIPLSALAAFGDAAVRAGHQADDRELVGLIRAADRLDGVASR